MKKLSKASKVRVGAVIAVTALSAGVGVAVAPAALAAGPNYCTSTEQFQLYYDGYVQVQAAFSDSGRHAKNGWLRYVISGYADSGRQYTPNTPSATSTAIKTKSYTFQDDLNPFAPHTQFSCGYTWW